MAETPKSINVQVEADIVPAKTPELCVSHGREIKTMAFRGTGFCSEDCKKLAGADVTSVGTIMFVTTEERHRIMKAREKKAHPPMKVPSLLQERSRG